MSKNTQYLIPNINKQYKLSQKSNMHSLSPNIKPIYSQPKKIQNNLFPKNNNNFNNIKVNKIRLKKEKIIEGELDFEDNNKKRFYLLNNQKSKSGLNSLNNNNKQRKRPNKSPIPIRAEYRQKDFFSFNKLFNSNNKYLNEQKYNQNLINNYLFLNNNIQFSKTFSSFYKKGDRSHTPILRTNNNKAVMHLGNNKVGNRIKRDTKSPILGKSFNFRKKDNFGFVLNNYNKDKKNNYVNNLNVNNIYNVNNKGIKGDIHNDIFFNNRNNNFKMNKGVNIVNVNINLRPISHNNYFNNNNKNKINLYDEEINMDLLNFNNNNIIDKNKQKINNNDNIKLKENNNNNNTKKIARPRSPKNNLRNNKNHIIIDEDNKKEKEKIAKEENKNKEIDLKDLANEELNIINSNTLNPKEQKKEKILKEDPKQKKMQRSHSQTPLDPLNQKNILLEEESPSKPQKEQPKKILKKIRDIYEFTHVGFDGEEPKENNQDNYFVYRNFADHKDYIYMSVCDGHGVEGHFVSDFVKDVLPYYMSENLKNTNILTEKKLTHQIITETFILVNSMLISNENINSLFSGSTCISVIFTPEKLIVPNIGDSRSVLGRYNKVTKSYKAIDLSRDHKPTENDEKKRIYENDGRIQPFTEEGEFVGPQRVWLKDEEVPGLAMSRSFGDRVAATVGVISEPEIKEFDFDEGDKFMIIASDGIWEFISSQECVEIIKDFYEKNDLKGCAEFLYEESSKRWIKEEEVIDDTTLILVFFD